ncbi:MAG TPA: hypothetical protein VML75_22025 [Kofleriaceae bacterium]|nr:hypothetical protein [Kofleriaceae bacterium]
MTKSDDPAPIRLPETNCQACGVGVVAGSSRCPRCRSALPTAALASRPTPWLWLAMIGIAGAGLAVFLLMRSGSEREPAAAEPSLGRGLGTGSEPVGGADQVRPGPPAPAATRESVLDELVRSTENRNLTATFEIRATAPHRVVVLSEQCEDPRLRGLLEERSAALAQVELAEIACVSADGTEQFSLSLR